MASGSRKLLAKKENRKLWPQDFLLVSYCGELNCE